MDEMVSVFFQQYLEGARRAAQALRNTYKEDISPPDTWPPAAPHKILEAARNSYRDDNRQRRKPKEHDFLPDDDEAYREAMASLVSDTFEKMAPAFRELDILWAEAFKQNPEVPKSFLRGHEQCWAELHNLLLYAQEQVGISRPEGYLEHPLVRTTDAFADRLDAQFYALSEQMSKDEYEKLSAITSVPQWLMEELRPLQEGKARDYGSVEAEIDVMKEREVVWNRMVPQLCMLKHHVTQAEITKADEALKPIWKQIQSQVFAYAEEFARYAPSPDRRDALLRRFDPALVAQPQLIPTNPKAMEFLQVQLSVLAPYVSFLENEQVAEAIGSAGRNLANDENWEAEEPELQAKAAVQFMRCLAPITGILENAREYTKHNEILTRAAWETLGAIAIHLEQEYGESGYEKPKAYSDHPFARALKDYADVIGKNIGDLQKLYNKQFGIQSVEVTRLAPVFGAPRLLRGSAKTVQKFPEASIINRTWEEVVRQAEPLIPKNIITYIEGVKDKPNLVEKWHEIAAEMHRFWRMMQQYAPTEIVGQVLVEATDYTEIIGIDSRGILSRVRDLVDRMNAPGINEETEEVLLPHINALTRVLMTVPDPEQLTVEDLDTLLSVMGEAEKLMHNMGRFLGDENRNYIDLATVRAVVLKARTAMEQGS